MTRAGLTSVLDELVPPCPERGLAGAGELDLADVVHRVADLQPVIDALLGALDEIARAQGTERFAELPQPERSTALRAASDANPELLPALVFHTFTAYYQHPRVLAALGLAARPPHPEGYVLEAGDLTLLDAVRRRPKLYRDC